MTAPFYADPEPPPSSWSQPHCTFPGCHAPAATVDGFNGKRCDDHPPAYDRAHAARLADNGAVADAVAYRRTFNEGEQP